MAKQKYLVEAVCKNSNCPTTEFKRLKDKAQYMGTDGIMHFVEKLVCPNCRCWGTVTRIDPVIDGAK